ncbi:reticulon-2-like [Thunnus maccoyii]|uniref:reticulon-2-like n=1 Tax=Thunnus maccoyii TaxID=8240 RepID=UPI001C4DD10C|nr:reticulon-2-like [Thunnus maccoyii]
MGQILGFSHCQEYGSVASTPDSTPPCTDGGNEESEMYELQTAREWSDDEEERDGDPDDDEGLASSPSIWGTPRQNSFELTFSYIAIAEAEAVGASRHFRDRRRGGSRGSRTPLMRTDTLETLLDSPDVDWDPQLFLSREEDEEMSERSEQERAEARTVRTASPAARRELHRQTETITIQPSPQILDPETQGRDAGIQREESSLTQTVQPPSPSPSSQQQSPSQILQAAASASPTPEPESPVTRETISVKLLTSVQPRGPSSSSPAAIGLNSQEQLVSDHWFSALNLSEDPTVCTHIAEVKTIALNQKQKGGLGVCNQHQCSKHKKGFAHLQAPSPSASSRCQMTYKCEHDSSLEVGVGGAVDKIILGCQSFGLLSEQGGSQKQLRGARGSTAGQRQGQRV